MADTKISGLPSAGALAGTEPLPIVQDGATKQTTVQDIANLAGGNQTLHDVLVEDNQTLGTNIKVNNADAIELENASTLKKGTYDFGANGGISRICGVGYEDMWQAGIHHVFDSNGFIRESNNCFNIIPDGSFDSSQRFKVGSRWVLDDGTTYVCSDASNGSAVWAIGGFNLQTVTNSGAETNNRITIGDVSNEYVQYREDGLANVFIDNTVFPVTTSSTKLAFITPTGINTVSIQDASGTLAFLSDIPSGTGDVTGPASSTDNNIAVFDGTTGKIIKDGGVTIAGINTNAVDLVTVKLSEAINKGQAVYVSGANGTNILVSKASNTSEATSSKTLGLLATSGATNAIVNVVTSGLLDGINTSAATIGDPVWLGTSGNLIYGLASKPYAPAHLVYIGVVSRVSATVGEIIVKVQNGFELREIHDVDLITNTPTNNQALVYESSSSLWKNKSLTTASVAASTDKNYVTDAQAVVISNTSGTNTGDQTLSGLGGVASNAAITGATKTKITYDTKGLVTSGADATTADIADSTNKRYVTDANLTTIGNQSGTNTGDETTSTIKTKLGITTLSGSNTGDQDLSTLMVKANNLSDLTNTSTARTNLKILDVYITTGDQTTSVVTASSITGLSWSGVANKRYKVSGIIHVGCSGVGGVKIQLTLPTGATMFIYGVGITNTGGTTLIQIAHTTSATLSAAAFCPVVSTVGYIKIDGEVQLSSTAGTVQFGFASGIATQTSTIYQLGSQLTITEI